ncbi:hypothetical protein AC249_AIPGENE27765 [Exaiptasia diaphana]|nr:hypothetical protein AC249_AIPGENE27765 [Exaiptasia diaphana]
MAAETYSVKTNNKYFIKSDILLTSTSGRFVMFQCGEPIDLVGELIFCAILYEFLTFDRQNILGCTSML